MRNVFIFFLLTPSSTAEYITTMQNIIFKILRLKLFSFKLHPLLHNH